MARLVFCPLLFAFLPFIFFHASSTSLPSVNPLPLLPVWVKPNLNDSSCSYKVEISTSCSSVSSTGDEISISFGDAYGNQVYVPRLDIASSHAFEQCSTDTFDIKGPCTYDICYVYLYRSGSDGWKADSVRISSSNIKTVTFSFSKWIPNDDWYGLNFCEGSTPPPSKGYMKSPSSTLIMSMVALLFSMVGWCF